MRRISGIVRHSIQHQKSRNILDIQCRVSLLTHWRMKQLSIYNTSAWQQTLREDVYFASVFFIARSCIVLSEKAQGSEDNKSRLSPVAHVVCIGLSLAIRLCQTDN